MSSEASNPDASSAASASALQRLQARQRTKRHWIWTLFENRTAVVGAVVVFIFLLMAILAPVISPKDPLRLAVRDRLQGPSAAHLLGTDQFGRDVASRVIYGARLSMGVGVSVGVAAVTLGLVFGLLSGYYKRADSIIMRFMDALMAFPSIIFAIVLMGILGASVRNVIIALTVVFMPRVARVARSSVLVAREEMYVEAARAAGADDRRIIARHIFPNIVSPLITQASYIFALAVLAEAALSFVGVGASPQVSSWGNMLSEGQIVVRQAPWITIFPGLAIVLVVFGANLFGDGLRDALDPRLRGD
jgi:peptide/nickel transport system permease protein